MEFVQVSQTGLILIMILNTVPLFAQTLQRNIFSAARRTRQVWLVAFKDVQCSVMGPCLLTARSHCEPADPIQFQWMEQRLRAKVIFGPFLASTCE
jgi:hypothetical protein